MGNRQLAILSINLPFQDCSFCNRPEAAGQFSEGFARLACWIAPCNTALA
jgi:hypothetical protein